MATSFALSWYRNDYWADKLHKPVGRAVSEYHSPSYEKVEQTAAHINSICPDMNCEVEVFT